MINKCLLHMIFRKLRLLQHLEAMKQVFFFNAGDVLAIFMQAAFNDDIESTLKDNSLAFLNSQLDLAVRSKPHSESVFGHE